MNREAFLQRVRQAAAAGRLHRVTTQAVPPGTGYVGAGEDPPARLADEIRAVGGQAYLVDTVAEARTQVASLLDRWQCRSALVWQHPVLERLGLASLLTQRQVNTSDYDSLSAQPPAQRRAGQLAAEVGITSTTWAIGETGSLVLASGPGRERTASLLPPLHLAIVTADQILPDLFDLFARLQPSGGEPWPSNLVLVTGPSKTGDIELQLTTGVHGPREWHVVVIRERL